MRQPEPLDGVPLQPWETRAIAMALALVCLMGLAIFVSTLLQRLKGSAMLSGYKTYITAGLAVIGAVAGYLVGDLTLAASAQLVVTALLGAFIRHGVASGA